jgi:hypothetical protein
VEVIFLNDVEYHLQFLLDVTHCFKTSSLQFHLQFGKQSEITGGYVWQVGRMGKVNHVVVSHKLWFSRMCGRVHCRDEGASWRCAKVPVFLITHFLSSISDRHSTRKSQSWSYC